MNRFINNPFKPFMLMLLLLLTAGLGGIDSPTAFGAGTQVDNRAVLAPAAATTWTGAVDTDWATAGNWDTNAVPTASDAVTIADVANDPVIGNGTTALATNVIVDSGAVLTVNTGGTLTIDGNGATLDGIKNDGTVTNEGTINIDDVGGNFDQHAIYNVTGTFNNQNNGVINIGTLGAANNIAGDGIQNHESSASFTNSSGSTITIKGVGHRGIFARLGSFTNEGTISIDTTGHAVSAGNAHGQALYNDGTFNNQNNGQIEIDSSGAEGIYNDNTFTNQTGGTINIGTQGGASNITKEGIDNRGTFTNGTGSTVTIKDIAAHGVLIAGTSTGFVNDGTMNIDNTALVGFFMGSSTGFNLGGALNIGKNTGGITGIGFQLDQDGFVVNIDGTTTGVSTGYGQVDVVGTVTLAGKSLTLSGLYIPQSGDVFTIINNDGADAISGTFNGLAEGATVTFNGIDLTVSYTGGDGNDVTLTYSGGTPPETIATLSSGTLRIFDVNSGTSDNTLTLTLVDSDSNLQINDPNNTLAGSGLGVIEVDANTVKVPVASITAGVTIDTKDGNDTVNLDAALSLGSGNLTVTTDVINVNANLGDGSNTGDITLIADTIALGSSINVQSTGDLIIKPQTASTTIGIAGGTGTLNLTVAELNTLQDGFSSITIGDVSNGTGAIDVDSSTFNDPVTIAGGSINVDQLDAGTNTVNLTARTGNISTEDGVAASTDVTGSTVTLNGDVAPGASPGQLVVDGNATFTNGETFNAELNGTTAGTNYDQVKVTGANRTVTLNNATLSGSISGYTPAAGDELVIIDNVDASSTVSGTFNGLAEGATVTIGNSTFIITYQGGTDNNDVVLQFSTGTDSDGVDDSVENNVPGINGSNTGDGNGDGTPDSQQEHVASLQGSTNDYVTFYTDSGKQLVNVTPESEPANAPTQTQFPYGHFSFDVTGLSVGEAFTVQLILHGNQSAPTTFWKYGPTADNNTDHWYEFGYDGTTGAQVSGNIITLHFVDGQRGDSDLTANGQIRDPGAPAINSTTAEPPAPAPSNQPPQVSTPMPDITVIEGAADQTINPFDYFNDPEGDLVFFYVTGNSNTVVVPNLPEGRKLGNIDQLLIQFGVAGQTEITIQAKEMWSHATVEDTFIVTVLERPTISISKSVSDDSVEAGQQINYTIAITNSGPSTATNALISDALPAGLTFVSGSMSASGITTGTIGTSPPTLASGVTLVPNQSIKLTFAATVNQELLANQTITNTAQLSATELITSVQANNLITTIPPELAISDVTVTEGDGSARFAVTLGKASALPVTVDFTTVEGSATAEDYSATSGTLTISAGETEGEITVEVTDDDLIEEQETFSLQLTNPSNGTITDGQALATITNNDYPPTSVELASVSVDPQTTASGYTRLLLALLLVSGLLLSRRIRK